MFSSSVLNFEIVYTPRYRCWREAGVREEAGFRLNRNFPCEEPAWDRRVKQGPQQGTR